MDIESNKSTLLYQLKGDTIINEVDVPETKLVVFDYEGTTIHLQAKAPTTLLFLAGTPIEEPVVSHGPFVMNTQTQIMEAMRDYQMGKMGVLI